MSFDVGVVECFDVVGTAFDVGIIEWSAIRNALNGLTEGRTVMLIFFYKFDVSKFIIIIMHILSQLYDVMMR